jgi:hypothetical protein
MPEKRAPDELEEYLRGDSALSRQYRRESAAAPPHALDRLVLGAALRSAKSKAPLRSQSCERNPAVWLEDIAALRRAGRDSEADSEMRRFRSAYPDYLIPVSE